MDHVGGAKDLLELYPNTKIYKHTPDENQQDIIDNQVFKVDGATLRSIYTPGSVQTTINGPYSIAALTSA
jgi:ribonuclease/clavin/mitogillin